jgi:hypothetical protein
MNIWQKLVLVATVSAFAFYTLKLPPLCAYQPGTDGGCPYNAINGVDYGALFRILLVVIVVGGALFVVVATRPPKAQ